MVGSGTLKVHRRVRFALNDLTEGERGQVREVLSSREAFDRAADRPGGSHLLSALDPSFFLLRVGDSHLRLLFQRKGDEVEVLDVYDLKTLEHFSHPASPAGPDDVGAGVGREPT